jgi:membrane dipeptidase
MPTSHEFHAGAIVIDAVSPLAGDGEYLDLYSEGGVTALCPTVAIDDDARHALAAVGRWHRRIRERPELLLVRTAADILQAKAEGRLGIVLHFQNSEPFETDLDLVDAFQAAGVRMIQLAYNVRNRSGDGCEEPSDAGLSRFGRALVERLEDVRVVIDCSHTGRQTTIDTVAMARRPPVVSHANASAVHPNPRNLEDDIIRSIADKDGLVGIVGFPGFVGPDPEPTLDQLIHHLEHHVRVGGIDHVGLGLDYYKGQAPFSDAASASCLYARHRAAGLWSDAYPPPPWNYPKGIETPAGIGLLTQALLARGWRDEAVLKVLGQNWLRVFAEVWGA